MSREAQPSEFADCVQHNITGDEKGNVQISLGRLFQAFGQPGVLDVGRQTDFRPRKPAEDGGGTAFADLVWKPVVLVEMERRGIDLQKHSRQAFDYWVRITGGRPRYVVLWGFDEFWVYDFDSDLDTPKDKLSFTDLPVRWRRLAFLTPGSSVPSSFTSGVGDKTRLRLPVKSVKGVLWLRSDTPDKPGGCGGRE